MKSKNNLVKFAMVFVCLLCLTLTAAAQRRKVPVRKKTTKPAATVPASTPAVTTNAEIREGAKKASDQLKSVTRFIYLLGSIAQGIEDVESEIKARKATTAAIDLNTRNKQGVIAALQKLRSDLVPVEVEFRAKPSLRNYVLQIGGISDIAGTAEEQAAAGQFKEAGRTLLQIVEKLSDTLAAMP